MGVTINNVEEYSLLGCNSVVRRQPNVSEACITIFSVEKKKAKPETSRSRWQAQ
jgi:hypothetical protein